MARHRIRTAPPSLPLSLPIRPHHHHRTARGGLSPALSPPLRRLPLLLSLLLLLLLLPLQLGTDPLATPSTIGAALSCCPHSCTSPSAQSSETMHPSAQS